MVEIMSIGTISASQSTEVCTTYSQTCALLQIDKLGRTQANGTIAGTYTADNNNTLVIGPSTADPGLAIIHLIVNGTNWLAHIAQRAAIDPASDIDLRLYSTDLEAGSKRAFRAMVQDKNALVDAGTPTYISWRQTVDVFQREGPPLDEFVSKMGDGGEVVTVEAPALGILFKRS